MKVAVYSPYLDTLGGGEKYIASIIKTCIDNGCEVDIFWREKEWINQVFARYEIDISRAEVDLLAYRTIESGNLWSKLRLGMKYDLFVWLSDGSLPLMTAKKNIVHFQVPFHGVGGNSLTNKLKLRRVGEVVCNSEFTKKYIDLEFGVNSRVIHPPATMILPGKKDKVILSVGRFDNTLHSKRQDVLIQAFEKDKFDGWRLILAGGLLENETNLDELRSLKKSDRVEILINPPFMKLRQLYRQAAIYWHAAGYGIDLEKNPESAEHFGISTVEAMSAGAVPVVFSGGGQKEIVTQNGNGFLWETEDELIKYTKRLTTDKKSWKQLSQKAIETSKNYSLEVFSSEWSKIIS